MDVERFTRAWNCPFDGSQADRVVQGSGTVGQSPEDDVKAGSPADQGADSPVAIETQTEFASSHNDPFLVLAASKGQNVAVQFPSSFRQDSKVGTGPLREEDKGRCVFYENLRDFKAWIGIEESFLHVLVDLTATMLSPNPTTGIIQGVE